MVPFYQLAVHLLIAASLLYFVLVSPFVLKRELSRWVGAGLVVAAVILLGGAAYAVAIGHWPFRA